MTSDAVRVGRSHAPSVAASDEPSLLVDGKWVAVTLGCSVRHVRRLLDAGLMPGAVRIGQLVRWRRDDIARWIERGCPAADRRGEQP
ncbi:MAG: helix-turn-helix domain-containing protein [Phycisphaerales bacterium]